jgi:hypothetical protein
MSREWDTHPGMGDPPMFVAAKATSAGRWIQCGGVAGHGATSRKITPVRKVRPATAPVTGVTV